MTPRSSATTGSGPSAACSASNRPCPGPGTQRPFDGGGLGGRDLPVAGSRGSGRCARCRPAPACGAARDPPGVAVAAWRIPAVQRVAPALAGGAEVVRRHAGHHRRLAVRRRGGRGRAAPRRRRCRGRRRSALADDLHALRLRMSAQRSPLAREAPLAELPEGDGVGMPGTCCGHRCRLALHQFRRPGRPAGPAGGVALRHEQGVVVQPVRLRGTEGGQFGPVDSGGAAGEAARRFGQPAHAPGHHGREVDAARVGRRRAGQRVGRQPAALLQLGQVDQQHVAGEGRTAHVGRVARADAAQRQHLPEVLAGALEPVDEVVGGRAQVAAAMRAGQGGGVQQHSAGAAQAPQS
jgi:hypothetical protein